MSCNEYITRRQAFEVIAAHKDEISNYDGVMCDIGAIEKADANPTLHAHWIENEDHSLTCSACGHTTYEPVIEARGDGVYELLAPYFCAKCGAKTDGGDNVTV